MSSQLLQGLRLVALRKSNSMNFVFCRHLPVEQLSCLAPFAHLSPMTLSMSMEVTSCIEPVTWPVPPCDVKTKGDKHRKTIKYAWCELCLKLMFENTSMTKSVRRNTSKWVLGDSKFAFDILRTHGWILFKTSTKAGFARLEHNSIECHPTSHHLPHFVSMFCSYALHTLSLRRLNHWGSGSKKHRSYQMFWFVSDFSSFFVNSMTFWRISHWYPNL